ncbi:MAG: hypothetical protein LC634_08960 [Sphingomonadales bacterium]|nr:hypothetical protein [Sphingomonadales bacterium]
MKFSVYAIAAVFLFAIGAAPASAQTQVPGTPGWGECVWERGPASAAFWMNMDRPEWGDNLETPAHRLGYRLVALCALFPATDVPAERLPDWDKLYMKLRITQPDSFAPTDPGSPTIELCRSYFVEGDEQSLFRADIVRVTEVRRFIAARMYFTRAGRGGPPVTDDRGRRVSFQYGPAMPRGGVHMVPAGLSVTVPDDAETETECQIIRSDGSLVDA